MVQSTEIQGRLTSNITGQGTVVPPVEPAIITANTFDANKDHEASAEEIVYEQTPEDIAAPKVITKVVRRIDLQLLPVLTLLLSVCFLDRGNMGLAAVAGMSKELGFVGYQYSITLLAFFPGYVLCVLPNNYLLGRVSIRYWLTFVSIGFGLFTLASGLIHSFEALAVVRAFLGCFEACAVPTIVVVLSAWYPRYYLGKRIPIVWCGATFIQSLAGILAYAFSRVHAGGYAGWRWIFILESILTVVVVGILSLVLDEYPNKSRMLNDEQRRVIMALIAKDRAENEEEKVTAKAMLVCLLDWKVWAYGAMYMFSTVTTNSTSYFAPLILNQRMGFSGALSQVLTTPPYLWAFILDTTLGWFSDHYRLRSPFICFFSINTIIGVTLLRWGPQTASQYLGIFLTVGGAFGNITTSVSMGQNNTPTRIKRNVVSGVQMSLGAIGGIIGSTVFRSQDAPTYTPGISTVIGCTFAIALLGLLLAADYRRLNKAHREQGRVLEGEPSFMYTL
ncbi:hypothetical protein LTS17_001117 [Exophiala oligosperma]